MGYGSLPPPPGDRGGRRPWGDEPGGERSSSDVTRSLEPRSAPPAAAPPTSAPPGGRPAWADAPPAAPASTSDGIAITSLVLGILGLLACLTLVGAVLGGPLGLVAIVLGIVGMRRGIQRGVAIAGLVTGVLAVLVTIALLTLGLVLFSEGGPLRQVIEEGPGVVLGGQVSAESPCAGAPDTSSFPAQASAGALRVAQVEVCADDLGDFQYGVQVSNGSASAVQGQVEVAALAGGQVVSQPSGQPFSLAGNEEGWVRVVTFDGYQPVDAVDVAVSTG